MRLFSNAVVRTFAPRADSSTPGSDPPASTPSDPSTPNEDTPAPTFDLTQPAPDAILVDGETIVAVGTRAELLDIAAAESSTTAALASAGGVGATTVIPGLEIDEVDCGGQVILPGFVDGHIHSIMYADSLTDLDLSQTKSIAEAVAAIRERADSLPVGTWVVGSGWDLNKWEDPSYPDRTLLDAEVPDHPVAMWSLDLHTLWVNAHALEIAGIDEVTSDPSGGSFVRDGDGQLTGLVREDATDLVARFIPEPSREEQVERLATTQALFLSQGLTGIHDFDGIAATLGWNDLHDAGRQDMRVTLFLRGPEVPWAIETGWHTGDGDDWLQCGGLKLFSDGALGSHTSHMSSAFPETDGETENFGIAQMTEDELVDQAHIATEAGISVAIHAIGDQANHHVLAVFERLRETTRAAEEEFDRPMRHRVEHAQFIQPSDVARFAELGVLASMQPRHCISDLHLLHLIDESAQLAAYAWPDLLDAGAHVVFGSDGPVEPANPFAAIYAAMTRANISGDASTSFQPHRRLSAVEAVRLHTQGPAFAAGLEDRRGYLASGMDADFILVDTDPCVAEGLDVEGLNPDVAAHADGRSAEAAARPSDPDGSRVPSDLDGLRPSTDPDGSHASTDGLLGYASEEALFAHAEAIRDTRVALTVVGGEIKYRA